MDNCLIDIYLAIEDLGEEILSTEEVSAYINLKAETDALPEIIKLRQAFQRAKDDFELAERFGHFHPDYHEAKNKARDQEKALYQHPQLEKYLSAEKEVNSLLEKVMSRLNAAVKR